MNKLLSVCLSAVLVGTLCIIADPASAQLSLDAQIRIRSELRDGYGAPLPKDATPAFFISQRSRLLLGYKSDRLKIGLTMQDVRVWGQDVSTINRTTTQSNNGLMVHEAWAELLLTDTSDSEQGLSVRLGRQELAYDDQRLIGNLDWPQQARRHDAAVLRFRKKSYTIHG